MGRNRQLVVGISGATCGGKTTISKLLQATFPCTTVIHQDTYFHPNDPKFHVFLPEIGCFDWELETALDFEKLEADVKKLLKGNAKSSKGAPFFDNMNFVESNAPPRAEREYFAKQFSDVQIIILEGHIIFNRPFLNGICDKKFFLTLTKDECYRRRLNRVYEPMPPPGFFDVCVWPSYQNRLKDVEYLDDIKFLNANDETLLDLYQEIKATIVNAII